MSALLDIRGLSAESDAGPVLRGVSLAVAAGEVHGLVGESGAGKSSIARAVLGILPPAIRITGGEVLFAGTDLLALTCPARRALVSASFALIPQDPRSALNPARRIGEQLTDGLRSRMARAEAFARAESLLAEVRIGEPKRVLRQYPHELSGGMRQRVLIAQAFALEPRLIVADEPTTALDATVQKQVLRIIRQMQERHGTAILFVTHNLAVVAQICARLTVLYGGKAVERGETARVFAGPAHAYTRALLAACPRHDRPGRSLKPVPEDVVAALRAGAAA